MWLWLALFSAVLLGFYDITKKKALQKNSPLVVLLVATAISTLFLSPCFFIYQGPLQHHLMLMFKALLVTAAWVSGMIALKLLPITIMSPLKATRPFFVVLFSVILFGERLNAMQWIGVGLAMLSIVLLSLSSKKEGITTRNNKGFIAIAISIVAGVASALYDKHIMVDMEPLFVQSWANFYITVAVGICLLVQQLFSREKARLEFKWDWMLPLTAVLITGADMAYFFALSQDGAMLSIISIMRRCAVIVTFVFGAIIFREKNIKGKALDLLILLAGMVFLMIGSN